MTLDFQTAFSELESIAYWQECHTLKANSRFLSAKIPLKDNGAQPRIPLMSIVKRELPCQVCAHMGSEKPHQRKRKYLMLNSKLKVMLNVNWTNIYKCSGECPVHTSKDMREEGNSIKEELEKQREELAELNEDILETKSSLLEVKVTITLASLEFETYWNISG